ncbi:DUF6438 domain-containing protein [Tenacibaculum sp. TC6]|uniref:DUF6438 domain-containing protein n=1 Tax=Tenacibaculum sp. TC6 TaxID=3423223 RepID=UPI003D363BA1
MKYLLFAPLLLALTCSSPKKENSVQPSNEASEETTTIQKEENKEKPIPVKNYSNELIVILKDPKHSDDAMALIKNSSLQWTDADYNSKTTKIGIVTLPDEDRDTWIQRLQQTGEFKFVGKNGKEVLKNIIAKEENKLISLRKTACFGDCPVYEVSIDKDGNVTYNGIQYVLEEGIREFKLTDEELKTLNDKLSKKDFSSFKDSYDNPDVMDLASTYITHDNKQIQIRLWKDIPDELIDIHEYIGDLLLKRKFFE